MKYTLLEMVQSILNDMDSEPVDSIGDSVEAQQVASVIRDTFFNTIVARGIPEHQKLLKLTSLSSTDNPTHFKYPDDVKSISSFQYNGRTLHWKAPEDFLAAMPTSLAEGYTGALDPLSGVLLYVRTDKDPDYYTSFDDEYIVCNSYDLATETTLQEHKTRCLGTMYPTFLVEDGYVPDLDEAMGQYLLAEAKSTCFSVFKSGSDPKIEQAARRLKAYVQNDQLRTELPPKRPHYGRRV
jgi:hypothetical protein